MPFFIDLLSAFLYICGMTNGISPNITAVTYSKIDRYIASFDVVPGVVIIHDLANGSVAYMSKRGLKLLGTTLDEIASMPHEDYNRKYFNEDDARDYTPKILGLLERNNDEELLSHFQQVRYHGSNDWTWHLSSAKIFHRDDDGRPRLVLALAIPMSAMHHITAKAERLLKENNFLRENYKLFSTLTRREKEVLRLTAIGKSAVETASELFMAVTTAETHRRNIKNKLNIATFFDLQQYARAFDLI